MQPLMNLPIGQQYFASVRKANTVYIDKTKYIYDLCSPVDRYYFLSRPRRFGKSLTLDTINELFVGNKTLFEGLWIEDKWDWAQTFPVIRLSLDSVRHKDGLTAGLTSKMHDLAKSFGVKLMKTTPGSLFEELIKNVSEKSEKQVVILIDEYDRPIVDYIDPYDLEMASKQRDTLKEFFGILKNSSNHIRFLLITGVSKFSKVSIFSDLNHLYDITLDAQFSALCGYTQQELETYFAQFLSELPTDTLEKMKFWYNGYSWDAKTFVYNPFSVLNFFKTKMYRNFWFETGTPTFLIKLLRKRFDYKLEETEVDNLILEAFTLEKFDDLDINSILLQTGYLTIKEITEFGTFILNYPNQEVKRSFGQFLLSEYTNTPVTSPHGARILRALENNEVDKAIQVINDLIVSVPDQNYIHNEEKFFHALVHLVFTIVGTDIRSEVHTATGRIDSIIVTQKRVFLFEFKLNQSADEALQVIKQKKYGDSLRIMNKPITAIGVNFSKKTKGVEAWKMEEL